MSESPRYSDVQRAAEILRSAESICVLKGAGISAESGVRTFRGAGGLWEGYRASELCEISVRGTAAQALLPLIRNA